MCLCSRSVHVLSDSWLYYIVRRKVDRTVELMIGGKPFHGQKSQDSFFFFS